jgi:cytochrome P450
MMFDAHFITNPYPMYSHLRTTAPLHWTEAWRKGAWLVPRYDDVITVLHDTRLSSQRRLTTAFPSDIQPQLALLETTTSRMMLFLDPPVHTRLRKLLHRAFSPQAVQRLGPRVQHLANTLLDRVAAHGEMEFMANFAHPLPVLVIAEMLGVPNEHQADFQRWSDDFIHFFGNPQATVETVLQAQASLSALTNYFGMLLLERRRRPGADLVSLLLQIDGDDQLTEAELLAQCALLLMAGHETTRNLFGNGLLAFLQHPDQWAMLKQNPALMRSAVREVVRYNSPVQVAGRTATESFIWHGQQIEQGQSIIVLLGSANHDSTKFSHPEQLDITRNEAQPLSFGHGPHFCIGAILAQLEAEIAFAAVVERMPNLKLLDDTPYWCPNVSFRGLARLPLAWC